MVAQYAGPDFPMLAQRAAVLATGKDGVFAPDAPWVLTSASVNFQAQGVASQHIVSFSSPGMQFPGMGQYLYAVDSASGNAATLRLVGLGPGVGQPPSPAAGMSSVTFAIPTLAPQLDIATYRLKSRLAIDEGIFCRGSSWVYQGVEDLYRVFRDAVVYETLADLYEANMRDPTQAGDWSIKARLYRKRAQEVFDQIYVRWGPTGTSQQPTTPMNTRLSR